MARRYDIWIHEHGHEPILYDEVRVNSVDDVITDVYASASEYFGDFNWTINRSGTGKTAFLVKIDGEVVGTIAIEPTSRRPEGKEPLHGSRKS